MMAWRNVETIYSALCAILFLLILCIVERGVRGKVFDGKPAESCAGGRNHRRVHPHADLGIGDGRVCAQLAVGQIRIGSGLG